MDALELCSDSDQSITDVTDMAKQVSTPRATIGDQARQERDGHCRH